MLIVSYLTITLIAFTSTTIADECSVVPKAADYFCKTIKKYIKQDNTALANHVCGCIKGLLMGNYENYCRADEYDFDDAPNCALAFKSKVLRRDSDSVDNKFTNFFINVLLTNAINVCSKENEEIIVDSIKKGIYSNYVILSLESIIKLTYDSDVAQSLILCYRDLRKLAQKQHKN